MKLDPGCCRCCRTSQEIAAQHAALVARGRPGGARRPVHGCGCRMRDPADRCPCSWCQQVLAWWPRCGRQGCEEPALWDDLCADHRRQKREAEQAAYQRSRQVRQPPRPPFQGVRDTCSLCGLTPLPGRRRSWCSDACVALWYVATDSASALRHLTDLHGWECWSCGERWQPGRIWPWTQDGGPYPPEPDRVTLEVEHVRPLWSLTDEDRTQLRWWLPFNLALLCVPCHRAKSKREAGERADLRRAGRGVARLDLGG